MNDELTENGTFINIEYHKSRVSELEKQLAKYDEIAAEYGLDGETMLALAKSQIETALDNARLREALAALQRRADAAVGDIKDAATTTEKVCKWCLHRGNPSCPWEGTYHHRGPSGEKIGVCNAWEWRGAQDEKGVEHERD